MTVIGAATAQPIIIDEESADIYCTNSDEGGIFLTLYGGTPKYQYDWSHDTTSTSIATDLPVGNYTVTVTDANGCSEQKTISIVHVDPLLDSLQLLSVSACGDCHLRDGSQSFFYFEDEYIAAVLDLETSEDMGETQVCADISDHTTYNYGDPVLQRCWTVQSEVHEKADYRLFFSDEELASLASAAGFANAEDLILSRSLYVYYYELQSDGSLEVFPTQLLESSFTLTRYDEEQGVWSLELFEIPNAKIELLAFAATLPLELLSFNGEVLPQHNELTWTTAQEVDLSGFVVERSDDGVLFDSIGWVTAGSNSYTYPDLETRPGDVYYRLEMKDNDGTSAYSHIVRLSRGFHFLVRVVNNPFTDRLFVEIDTDKAIDCDLLVLSINGQLFHRSVSPLEKGRNDLQLDLSTLPGGNYIIRFQNTVESLALTKKIVKI